MSKMIKTMFSSAGCLLLILSLNSIADEGSDARLKELEAERSELIEKIVNTKEQIAELNEQIDTSNSELETAEAEVARIEALIAAEA